MPILTFSILQKNRNDSVPPQDYASVSQVDDAGALLLLLVLAAILRVGLGVVLAGAGLLRILAAAALVAVRRAVLLLHCLDRLRLLLAGPALLFSLATTVEGTVVRCHRKVPFVCIGEFV